jgi:hypothetical protein
MWSALQRWGALAANQTRLPPRRLHGRFGKCCRSTRGREWRFGSLRDVFGEENMAVRSVIGVTSLPLGVPIELEIIFELYEQQGE